MGIPFGCVSLVFAHSFLATAASLYATCSDHPAYFPGLVPELVTSWDVLSGNRNARANYHPRHTAQTYVPVFNTSSLQLAGLDFFWATMDPTQTDSNFIRLDLQRAAKVYLLVPHVLDVEYPTAELPGWASEGYVKRVEETFSFDAGVNEVEEVILLPNAHAFSKVVMDEVVLPHEAWVKKNVKGLQASAGWTVWVGEKDGSPVRKPTAPDGVAEEIVPNKRCPDQLHDLWVTPNTDDDDDDTKGMMWPTWHPMWDPCYWCAYDHDHGSSPQQLMNYSPKFGYVAWKNGRETESNEGFKGMVFKKDDYLIYYMIHGQTSSLRKLRVKFHTITLVVANASTKEVLLEFTHKGFFGFLAARAAVGSTESKFVPLTEKDADLEQELLAVGATNKISVNVIDVDNPDPIFRYREDILNGEYEDWTTNTICSPTGRRGMITTDFTNPAVGIKSMEEKDVEVQLGAYYGSVFRRHNSVVRILVFNDLLVSEENCDFEEGNFESSRDGDGYFYTDAFGKKLMPGPGPSSVKQLLKAGVVLELKDIYRPTDPWVQLYESLFSSEPRASSYGFGINPGIN